MNLPFTTSTHKPNTTKRHYWPVACGAPFVTCLKCLKLLQLPADFLLFKRVCHKLKCGACQEVLKFSLHNRIHIVSYAPNTVGLPPSELEVHNMLINSINSHAADPVSYSDDYGHSASKSYSSEGDPVSVAPFHHLYGGARGNPRVSPTTIEAITSKEKITSRGPSTSKIPSDKSSKIEEHESQPKPSSKFKTSRLPAPKASVITRLSLQPNNRKPAKIKTKNNHLFQLMTETFFQHCRCHEFGEQVACLRNICEESGV